MPRKTLCNLLTVCLIIGTLLTGCSRNPEQDITWTLQEGTLTISGKNISMLDYDWYVGSPWGEQREEIQDIVIQNGVTSVGAWAFYGCANLESVTIPNSVASIGKCAFRDCHNLTSITISDSVSRIEEGVFTSCTNLTDIHVDANNVTFCSIDGVLFSKDQSVMLRFPPGKTNPENIYRIPDGVTRIGDAAFAQCLLHGIIIPDSVNNIGRQVFADCAELTSVNVSANHPVFSSTDGVLLDKEQTAIFCFPAGKTGVYTIPNTVTRIEDFAFYACGSLTGISIPDSVNNIGEEAFSWCNSLNSVTIPDSVTYIGGSAFAGCSSLHSVTIPSTITQLKEYIFYGCDLSEVHIPDSVTDIDNWAFALCKRLNHVTVPDKIKRVGDFAFYGCDSLNTITLPNSIDLIGQGTFAACDALADIYYHGGENEWAAIEIGADNTPLTDAAIHYSSVGPA